VSDRDLRSALEDVLRRRVLTMTRRPNDYGSSYAIEDVELTFEGGRPLSLVFKDVAASALNAAAGGAKPAGLLDPDREIAAYRHVLGPARLGVPDCYGAVAEPEDGRYWLFLEAVDGVPLWQATQLDAWDGAARWLADLHGRGAPARQRHLLDYDAVHLGSWLDRALAFTPTGSLDPVVAVWQRVVDRLSSWPRTFVHGEFYPSNVLVRRSAGPASVVPVDWEMAGIGPGLLDLGALTSGSWSAAERDRLALVYRDSLARAVRPSADDLLEALAHCRLYIAVQWLGWSQDWSPPAEHAHDWLAEAVSAAEELGP
jgi:aminoglycoside phosphotransferase (APT) family kinase protein